MIPHAGELKVEGTFPRDIVVRGGGGLNPKPKQAEGPITSNIVVKGVAGLIPIEDEQTAWHRRT